MARGVWLILTTFTAFVVSQQDKTTDENRPYKFGFNIQGYQHRKEEKDEKGIINGEYGFITADGYYRITVYATDENGSFKIISMKNIYVGFPPEDPTTTPAPEILPGQKLSLKFGSETPAIKKTANPGTVATLAPTTAITQAPITTKLGRGKEACAGCFLPTTTTTSRPAIQQPTLRPSQRQPGFSNIRQPNNSQGGRNPVATYGSQPNPQSGNNQANVPLNNRGPQNAGNINGNKPNGFGITNGQLPQAPGVRNQGQPFRGAAGGAKTPENQGSTPYNPVDINNRFSPDKSTRGPFRQPGAGQGISNTNPVNRKNTYGPGAGSPNGVDKKAGQERDGLPPGVSEDDLMDLLYRFNYTVGFHGHHEDGYVSGNKKGDYFIDGRDGVERRVEYIANEFGYQPNITLTPLGDNDVRKPKEETEKEFGLKGYEFKWFRTP